MARTLMMIAALLALLSSPALAGELSGVVVDAADESPVVGARVIAIRAGVDTYTDAAGRYRLALGEGRSEDDLRVELDGAPADQALTYVRQRVGEERMLHVLPPDLRPEGGMAWGAPLLVRPDDGVGDGPVSLTDLMRFAPLGLTISGPLPDTIRVGRRMASSCSGNPVQRIDSVPLEEYVEGVLLPEIGVFRAVEGGEPAAAEVFKAFAVAARSYAVWFYFRDPDADFHIDDTACNQRYEDARNGYVATQVAASAGSIMVQAADETVLDKFEYAASCGRHGSRPEYQDALVPDETGLEACVRAWCGHNDCAGHEVNPALPDSGRCLVRGICQWGSVERSMRGDSYLDIIAHYQPNLSVVRLGEAGPTRLVGFVRVGDVFVGPGVSGVDVGLDTGESASTDGDGFFAFEDVTPGLRTLTYSGGGIVTATQDRDVVEGITNWGSIAVERLGDAGDTGPDTGGPDTGGPVVDSGRPDASSDAGDASDIGRPDARPDTPPDSGDPGDIPTDQTAGASLDARLTDTGAEPSTGYLSLYTLVSDDVSVERGCSAAAGAPGLLGATIFALLFARDRRRSA